MTVKDFLFKNYSLNQKFTDCSFMDNYLRTNYAVFTTPVHAIVKKGESVRKQLWSFKRKGVIKEVSRVARGDSDEITYELITKNIKPLVVTEVQGNKVEEKEIKTGFIGFISKLWK